MSGIEAAVRAFLRYAFQAYLRAVHIMAPLPNIRRGAVIRPSENTNKGGWRIHY